MAIKVVHLKNDALLGRYPHSHIKTLFAKHEVEYLFDEELPKKIWLEPVLFNQYCRDHGIAWICWHWEKFEPRVYQNLYESDRSYKIFLFGHEQPQALSNLREISKYADFTITSSSPYASEVDGFLPFGIHTYYFKSEKRPFTDKQKRILISGSYRHSRGQFFEWLLREQPFDWPVYLFTPPLQSDTVERDDTRKIVSRYPKYVYKCAETHRSYIPELLEHLNNHKLFLDFTTNSTNYLKFHEDYETIMQQAKTLKGGYCPERVLDALWLGTYSWCLYDQAIVEVLEDYVGLYENRNDLVSQVNRLINNQARLSQLAYHSQVYVERYTTENIIRKLADFFKSGRWIPL